MSNSQIHLPQESFVAVPAEQLTDSRTLWAHDGQRWRDVPFERYALSTMKSGDEGPDPARLIVAIADRYGGVGTGIYGGSARCAILNGIQIKGVGLTPLHSLPANGPPDPWHSTGTTNIFEAGREAVFSRICELVLPFGAVSCGAVLSTGSMALPSHAISGSQPSVPRVLILRDFAVRPAHFLRNIRFKPASSLRFVDDSARIRSALRTLPGIFERELGVSGGNLLNDGLVVAATRYATQLAAAHAKRLFHAALSPSNIALDGRFIDFGTMTAVPGYLRRSGAPDPAGPDLWDQNTLMEHVLLSLQQHFECYIPPIQEKPLITAAELVEEFRRVNLRRTAIEFTKLCGLPESAVRNLPSHEVAKTYRCMRDIALRGNHRVAWRGDGDSSVQHLRPVVPGGHHDLSKALRFYAQANGSLAALVAVLRDDQLAGELHRCISTIYGQHLERLPTSAHGAVRAECLRRCVRLNGDIDFLTREALDGACAAFDPDPTGFGDFVDSTVSRAVQILSDTLERVEGATLSEAEPCTTH